jgi:hypothetical protein
MNLGRRVKALELDLSTGGTCPHGFRAIWPPEDGREPSGPEKCEACDRPRRELRVVYEEAPNGQQYGRPE